ncbi:MAG: DNA repair protein RecN [Deltaproteobacteria bacterium]|nr:DNA repair protein RecN [Deltaproteobacteria bacterium]
MLVSLAVRDFVLIDGLTLELGPGLNVLTGETGAGKSILVDALALVLGGRARPEVIRTGRDGAEVEALFDISAHPALRAQLAEAELSGDGDELVVRRVVSSSGRSKAYVNGRLVPAAQLAALIRGLVDVSSQHESQTLCDPSTHAALLDAYAGLASPRDALSKEVTGLLALDRAIEEARARIDQLRAREDFLRFQLHELDELDPKPGEERELEGTRARLRHADRLASATRRAADRLDEGDDSVLDALRRIANDLSHVTELDESLAAHVRTIEGALAELEDVARTLSRYAGDVEADPGRLADIEDRLFKLQRLLRKHGPTTEDLLAHRQRLADELAALDSDDVQESERERERKELLSRATAAARKLSGARHKAARALGEALATELATLAMGRARIVVDVAPIAAGEPEGPEALAVALDDGTHARLTRGGIDRVEIMIAPNPGEDPRPLRRIASGGELSRSLLAIKRVLASPRSAELSVSAAPAGLYVFDEVDAGVGGAVAEAIGRKIADVAKSHQVLCITHLPQIAAFADTHFTVSKREEAGRTVSEVRRVEGKQRVEELARMLGGATVTATTRKMAEEMIRDGKRGKAPVDAASRPR